MQQLTILDFSDLNHLFFLGYVYLFDKVQKPIESRPTMEYLHEGIFLGIDAILLGFCVKEYCSQKQILNALKVSKFQPFRMTSNLCSIYSRVLSQ